MALALVVVACSPSGAVDDTVPSVSASSSTSDSSPSTTPVPDTSTTSTTPSSSSPTTTVEETTTSTAVPLPPPTINPEITIPDGDGPFPALVLVHGGGWVAGNPSIMRALARDLADEGFLVINTDYTLADDQPGYPAALHDVSCAVRLAQSHELSDGTVAVIGHSAGAHIGSVVALAGDLYGDECEYPGTGLPERFVGLSGPYDVARLGLLMIPFFGGGPQVEPDAWFAGNPHNLVDENQELSVLLLHGDADGLVEIGFSFDFEDALNAAGVDVLVEVVEGGNHPATHDPDVVGDLIATWLLR